jgi:exodeoxyribonuclease V alpha subunit
MRLAQRFARIFAFSGSSTNQPLDKSSEAIAPVAFVLWSAVNEGQVAIERQAMFERMGPQWDEQAALESNAVHFLNDSEGNQQEKQHGKPVVFGFGHWYLQRFAAIEQRVAAAVFALNVPIADSSDILTSELAGSVQTALVSSLNENQQQALRLALRRRLLVLTGGPGTGKTYTLVAIVNALRTYNPSLRIAACAPTGKAALRFGSQVKGLSSISTMHRLLMQPRNRFGYLDFDLVMVDEASMLDAVLADEFLQAIGPETRLILAGDKNQLSSVRAGAVFSQLCSLEIATVQLTESVRFGDQSSIGQLALAVLSNQIDHDWISRIDWAGDANQAAWFEALRKGLEPLVKALRENLIVDKTQSKKLLILLKAFGVLVPTHEGPTGTIASHDHLHQWIKREPSQWYHGRVIAVTQNDEATGLRNGDIGLIVNTIDGPRAAFDSGSEDVLWLAPAALPAHDDGWVLTVHKSQGSEYQSVLLALPQIGSPQSRRELVYTAITRAKESIRLFGTIDQLAAAAATKTERAGGLHQRLAALEG